MRTIFIATLWVVAFSIGSQFTNPYSFTAISSTVSSQKKPPETQTTTVKGSKSNSDNRTGDDKGSAKPLTGKVIRVDEKGRTFTITATGKEVTFDAKKLKNLPAVGETIDVNYSQSANGQMLATSFTQSPITGKVIRVNEKERTFVVMSDGEEVTFSARKMKTLPRVGSNVNVNPNAARFIFSSCEECNAKCPGVCFLGPNYCRCYLEPLPPLVN